MGVSVHDIQEGLKLMGFSLDDLADATEMGGIDAQKTLDALKDRVKHAYRKCAISLHPDKHGNTNESEDNFRLLNLAHEAVRSAKLRKVKSRPRGSVDDMFGARESVDVVDEQQLSARLAAFARGEPGIHTQEDLGVVVFTRGATPDQDTISVCGKTIRDHAHFRRPQSGGFREWFHNRFEWGGKEDDTPKVDRPKYVGDASYIASDMHGSWREGLLRDISMEAKPGVPVESRPYTRKELKEVEEVASRRGMAAVMGVEDGLWVLRVSWSNRGERLQMALFEGDVDGRKPEDDSGSEEPGQLPGAEPDG